MELTISKREFLRGLGRTYAVADRKSSMPILSNVLLSAHGTDSVRLSATDLYLGVTSLVAASVKKGGSIALSARTLHDIVKNLPEGDVSLSVEGGHHCTIRSGKVKYRIPGMPGDDFPQLPNPGEATFHEIDVDVLSDLVGMTSYSMSTDDTRPHLAGTKFEGDGKILRMVTTDGHRLSKAEHQKTSEEKGLYNFEMLIPHKGIFQLKGLLEDAKASRGKTEEPLRVGVASTAGNAFFRRDGVMLSVKLADEQFPPYSKVIPQRHKSRIVASRSMVVEALRRINLVAADKSGGMQLRFEAGVMRIQSQNPDVGEGVEDLDVDYGGEALTIGFNAKYLLDVLSALPSDEIALELGGELDPAVIKPVGEGIDFVGVIMPMRI